MALVKFGGGISQMSGSIAGNTFARNRFGNYVRARTKPVNPNSTLQAAARSRVGSLTQAWRTALDAAERLSWSTYAAAVGTKNKLGETVFLTGLNHFVRSNSTRLQVGKTVVEPGPTVLALPEKDPILAVSASVATQLLTMVYDVAQPWMLEANAFLAVYQGEPQNATRNFFAGPWRFAGKILQNVAPTYTVPCSFTLVLGQKVWVYARIGRADGRLSEPMVVSCVVAA